MTRQGAEEYVVKPVLVVEGERRNLVEDAS
jgi:hypothetical protein